MITLCENQLVISIQDAAPKERRDWLIQAIAAAMRWSAHEAVGLISKISRAAMKCARMPWRAASSMTTCGSEWSE